nr:MAG TPA: hypothetical protein [Caudoviricetes sp.]
MKNMIPPLEKNGFLAFWLGRVVLATIQKN